MTQFILAITEFYIANTDGFAHLFAHTLISFPRNFAAIGRFVPEEKTPFPFYSSGVSMETPEQQWLLPPIICHYPFKGNKVFTFCYLLNKQNRPRQMLSLVCPLRKHVTLILSHKSKRVQRWCLSWIISTDWKTRLIRRVLVLWLLFGGPETGAEQAFYSHLTGFRKWKF